MATNIVDTWIEEGIQKGIQQGIQQGIQKDKVLVVKNLLNQGILTPEQIGRFLVIEPSQVLERTRLPPSSRAPHFLPFVLPVTLP